MKSTFKILLKLLILVILLLISPLYSILESHVKSMDVTGYFALERVPKQLDINDLSMMKMVRKEDIPEREIDTEKQEPVKEIKPIQKLGKSIYIYSTHQKENYKDHSTVMEASDLLKEKLINKGYDVVVEKRDFSQELRKQNLNYNDSYLISRNALNDALSEHHGFDLIIDFHRDSVPRETTFIEVDGKVYAKLMIVLGGLSPHIDEIYQNAATLFDLSNQMKNGIMKQILVREAYYNQDMSKNMLLIEVGSEENYYEEVKNSVDILASAIDEMMR